MSENVLVVKLTVCTDLLLKTGSLLSQQDGKTDVRPTTDNEALVVAWPEAPW